MPRYALVEYETSSRTDRLVRTVRATTPRSPVLTRFLLDQPDVVGPGHRIVHNIYALPAGIRLTGTLTMKGSQASREGTLLSKEDVLWPQTKRHLDLRRWRERTRSKLGHVRKILESMNLDDRTKVNRARTAIHELLRDAP